MLKCSRTSNCQVALLCPHVSFFCPSCVPLVSLQVFKFKFWIGDSSCVIRHHWTVPRAVPQTYTYVPPQKWYIRQANGTRQRSPSLAWCPRQPPRWHNIYIYIYIRFAYPASPSQKTSSTHQKRKRFWHIRRRNRLWRIKKENPRGIKKENPFHAQ